MKILVTGANGFIGKNLVCELKNRGFDDLYLFDKESSLEQLDQYTSNCDFVFHLAGINRPLKEEEFIEGNVDLLSTLLVMLSKHNNKCPIMISSSIQALLDNPYGKSKKMGEDLLVNYSLKNNVKVYIYRFANVYGKWSRPNYNSAIATFCYNISRDLPITVHNRDTVMRLNYIDDVVKELIDLLNDEHENSDVIYCKIENEIETTLGHIVDLIYSFKESRTNLYVVDMKSYLEKTLYSTYLSFLPEDKFSVALNEHKDNRGSFTEIIKSDDKGQFSVNIIKPGIVKGNHYHHTKNEKFLVVSGHCLIKFRKVDSEKIITYDVSDNQLELVDIPVGYTHSIQNIGEQDAVVFMWCNECYDENKPDTYKLNVE